MNSILLTRSVFDIREMLPVQHLI
uniref:Uncharacterized protein n=1 Tax=Arundo donax TaxID=35708 RepID=A0A0A9U561_ARUDO